MASTDEKEAPLSGPRSDASDSGDAAEVADVELNRAIIHARRK